jgi:hypothetical protein
MNDFGRANGLTVKRCIVSQTFYNSAELRWFLDAQEDQRGQFLEWFTRQEQLQLLVRKKISTTRRTT